MMTARLVVDASSVAPRSSGPATGDITLMVGSVAFPIAGWNDFVVVILEAWLAALVRLVRGTSEQERVHFMEGPYGVDMTRLDSSVIRLRAFERPKGYRAVVDVALRSLVENAVETADDVLRVCQSKAHRSSDVQRLELATAALRGELPKLAN
jgi:hypothetical protein